MENTPDWMHEHVFVLQQALDTKNEEIKKLQCAISTIVAKDDEKVSELEATMRILQEDNLCLEKELIEQKTTLSQQDELIAQKDELIAQKESEIVAQKELIAQKREELEDVKKSADEEKGRLESYTEKLERESAGLKEQFSLITASEESKRQLLTLELIQCIEQANGNPSVHTVTLLVRLGASVTAINPVNRKVTLLYSFMDRNQLDLFAACLQTPHSIDWTISLEDGYKNTILHQVFHGHCLFFRVTIGRFPDKLERILELVLARLSAHGPTSPVPDKVDWAQKDNKGHDCLSWAAYYGHLALFWRLIVKYNVSYYVNHEGPIPITYRVHGTDIKELREIITVPPEQIFAFQRGFNEPQY